MKKVFSLLLAVLILASMCVPVLATSGQVTLLYNNSFESKESNAFSGSMRRYEYSEEYAKTGKVSIKAIGDEKQTGGWMWVKNDVTFEKGKTYSVRFFAMSETKDASVSSQLFIGGSNSITSASGSKAIPIGTWGEHVTSFVWTDDATAASVLIKFSGEGNIYIDDLEIYEGEYIKEETPDDDTSFEEIKHNARLKNIYVDINAAPDGNGSLAAPFDSIEDAQNYVRTINKNMEKNIVVNIMEGTYTVDETILLTDEDSGSNGLYVIYQPYNYGKENPAQVVISGGKKVTGWTESEISGVYKAPLDIDYVRNLYVNGTRAQRARYNQYVTPISWWDDTENTLSAKDGFVIPGGIIKNPENATNLEIYRTATFRSNWAVKGKAIENGDTTIISMEQPYFLMHELANYSVLEWKITNNFRLENALEFLDEPGEWYHDADTNTLYYMPREGESITNCDVIAPDVEQILNIGGSGIDKRAENIIVRGLTFSYGADKKTSRLGRANLQSTVIYSVDAGNSSAAPSGYTGSQMTAEGNINIFNAKNVSLRDNVINHMGSVAVAMPSTIENCEIKGNAIYDISSSAITVGSARHDVVTDNAIVPKNILVTNNIMAKTGVEYEAEPAFQGYFTNGLTVSHNEVYDATYSGICVGWGWTNVLDTKKNNTIEYNRIYNHGTACQDGGAIYTLGKQPNSVVRGNFVRSYEQSIVGIYHDEGSSGFTTTGNVVEMPHDSSSSGLYDHSGYDELYIRDNYTNVINTTNGRNDFCDNFTDQGITRSPEALEIREFSGLTDEYKSLRDKVDGYSDNREIKRIYIQTKEHKNLTPVNLKKDESLTLVTLAETKSGEIKTVSTGLTYEVSDTSVLGLSGSKITAKEDGITTVTVTDSSGRTAHLTVTVGDEVVSFEVLTSQKSAKTDKTLNVIYRLKTKYTEFVAKPKKSEMRSSDTDILTVMSDGTIKTVGEGIGTILVNTQCKGFEVSGSALVVVTNDTYRTFEEHSLNSNLKESDVLGAFDKDETLTLTEKEYTEVLSAIIQRDIKTASDKILTKEKMVAIMSDVITEFFCAAPMGDTELHQYTDRAEIDPSLVPKIANAYEYGLLSWLEVSSAFEPKRQVTVAEAAEFLFYFARPELKDYLRMDEYRFSTYETVAQWLMTNSYEGKHNLKKQRNIGDIGEECIEIANTIHEGTESSAIESGELVQKFTRKTAYDNVSIVLLNNIDFKPGKNYKLTFSAKVSPNSQTSGTPTWKNTLSVSPRFTVNTDPAGIDATEINSSEWTDFSLNIGIPEDSTYPVSSNSIYIRLRNTASKDTSCYDILLKDVTVTEEQETIEMISSSVKDNEKDVMTPIDSIYIYAGGDLDETAVTAENFAITGKDASIRDFEVVDSRTIRIGIDGCLPENDYTLTITDVPGKLGGTLNRSISWTTAVADSVHTGGWDFEASNKDGISGDAGISGVSISSKYAHTGKNSVEISTTTHANVYVNGKKSGVTSFEVGKEYQISYWIYSPKTMRTGMYKLNGPRFVELTTIPAGKWIQHTGVFRPTEDAHVANDVFMLQVYDNPGTCYIDDVKISELPRNYITVYRPNIFKDGIPVTGICEGQSDVQIKISGDAQDRNLLLTAAQYEEKRMTRAMTFTDTVSANSDKTVKLSLSNAQKTPTKILIMDLVSFAPCCNVIKLD